MSTPERDPRTHPREGDVLFADYSVYYLLTPDQPGTIKAIWMDWKGRSGTLRSGYDGREYIDEEEWRGLSAGMSVLRVSPTWPYAPDEEVDPQGGANPPESPEGCPTE